MRVREKRHQDLCRSNRGIYRVADGLRHQDNWLFSIAEKIVNEAPAVGFHQQSTIRSCENGRIGHIWYRFPAIWQACCIAPFK
jgi:hypothetical protein